MKKFLAAASAVVLSLAMLALPSVASADQPADLLCTQITDASYSPKVDANADDPFFVNIPAGFTLVAYCVKAGTEPVIVTLGTPVVGPASVQIDHPNKDSVSHYQLKLITTVVVDVCDNIDGAQATVPEGKVLAENGTSCVDPPTDVCDNIDGVQTVVPEGKVLAENGTSCVDPPTDVCDNIDGVQTVVPEGKVLAENGTSCVYPPDDCPDLVGGLGLSVSTDDCPDPCPTLAGARGLSVSTIVCPDPCLEVSGARGLSVSTDDKCDVDVSGTATDQVCVPSNDGTPGTFEQGSIQLTVSPLEGVEKIVYSMNGGAETEVDLGGNLLIENLAPGTYDFVVTVADGYESVNNFSVKVKADNSPECKKVEICHWTEGGFFVHIDVSVQSIVNPNGHALHEKDIIPPFEYVDGNDIVSFPGLNQDQQVEGCNELPTEGPVMPKVTFTPATCERGGSYTLISPAPTEGLPAKTVTWYVNDVETEQGTHSIAVGQSVTIKVVANSPSYVLDYGLPGGFVTEYTYPAYTFTAPTACDLNTLALTGGAGPQPALALTALLGLLGVAMVRSGSRINRNRKEA